MIEILDPNYKKRFHYEHNENRWVMECYIKGCKNKKADIMEVYCWSHLLQFYEDGSMKNERMIRKVRNYIESK